MPRREDIKTVMILGAGPIVIGQACEFDYSGTQACKSLQEEGYRVVLMNSNPATIMTDPEVADRTYLEPITPATVARILEKEGRHGRTAAADLVDRSWQDAVLRFGLIVLILLLFRPRLKVCVAGRIVATPDARHLHHVL